MNQLSLPEAVQTKDIIIGCQGVVSGLDSRSKFARQLTSLVNSLVLVQLVGVELEVLLRLGKAQRVEASVT